ncbi:hypothetical protein B9Q11_03295 [Candidatus Marsarchaeota G2 archaeon ECH_B_SAG-F08]|jgi:DNA-directed RNA polymerase, subunit E''''|uniref:Transcription elongation factor Spt4 n=6 Tax=Candidatus Marsarchaeota TaxID=1978152 RepID=A0A2R6AK56_9ARCH|nr:MAG: hypothetical protein B9Q02_00825 [Candidatus Marsarchaeota G1 archaeon BE_D]PSN89722.1 MAG: hypothetical protein B9Q00_00485 [Candidatus Marsarchaeota G1 archaeon OSP_C]PSN92703.1 MAG: hypothetical protein B9P99_03370 [Candidatus Marsarchaeota G1 archaeon OSP_B]PSN97891.1 MAG: hypothetical protein B9Q11_03295 [Candidatus Marsarchaeota G2 archaeon ECH_B_SAG-F08]PSO02923.1 MAG: hypothetical protein B9Q10_00790 [Candidatus Marsarchaeota G2 archaeon ECH_B_SAG-E12]PSO03813.1 MAG: hypothetic
MPTKKSGTPYKACRECRYLNSLEAQSCENCGSQRFADVWEGLIIVYDIETSKIAQELGLKKPGKYALTLY